MPEAKILIVTRQEPSDCGNFEWTFNPADGPDRDPNPHDPFVTTSQPCSLTISPNDCTPPQRLSEEERDDQFAETVYDSTITDMDSTLMEYMREQAFYKMATENDEVINQGVPEDADYQQKYNDLETSNTGEIAKADEEIAEGDYTTALARINALLDENTHEYNKMAVQEIYINNYAQDIEPDAGTIIQLENIAYSHPFYGGEAVYIARAMLGIDVEDAFPTARLANPNLTLEQEQLKTQLYPNPTTHTAWLSAEKESEQKLTVLITDVYGKQVEKITGYSNFVEINTQNYKNGIYLVNVYIDNTLKSTKKLTVLK